MDEGQKSGSLGVVFLFIHDSRHNKFISYFSNCLLKLRMLWDLELSKEKIISSELTWASAVQDTEHYRVT